MTFLNKSHAKINEEYRICLHKFMIFDSLYLCAIAYKIIKVSICNCFEIFAVVFTLCEIKIRSFEKIADADVGPGFTRKNFVISIFQIMGLVHRIIFLSFNRNCPSEIYTRQASMTQIPFGLLSQIKRGNDYKTT